MRCPTLNQLPPPPPDKSGWPWTEESSQLPDKMSNGCDWQRISIVTPNYNYGHFLEETVRSVLLQGYPNLEYIIIDGGSTDYSVEIIKKYEAWLTYWVSEKDHGQSNAINKGLKRCTGEIFNWINSDDLLALGGLEVIAKKFNDSDLLAGSVKNFSETNQVIHTHKKLSAIKLIAGKTHYHQPGIWLRTNLIRKIGDFNQNLNYSFDWDLTVKYLEHFPKVIYVDDILTEFRMHSSAKTNIDYEEIIKERKQSLVHILNNHEYISLHKHIQSYLKNQQWLVELKQILDSKKLTKLQKLDQIFHNSLMEPKIRISRFTIGAIRKLLFTLLNPRINS
jgi:glycosyltransferase involved in cell wall biosynthesis